MYLCLYKSVKKKNSYKPIPDNAFHLKSFPHCFPRNLPYMHIRTLRILDSSFKCTPDDGLVSRKYILVFLTGFLFYFVKRIPCVYIFLSLFTILGLPCLLLDPNYKAIRRITILHLYKA